MPTTSILANEKVLRQHANRVCLSERVIWPDKVMVFLIQMSKMKPVGNKITRKAIEHEKDSSRFIGGYGLFVFVWLQNAQWGKNSKRAC